MTGLRRRRPGPRLLAGVVLLVGALVGGYFWVRSSPLSAVREVRITGLSGPAAGQIRESLQSAAQSMSTLNVSTGDLHNAVAAYPEVESVTASASFPHSITIHVVEQNPVAVAVAGGHRTVVSGDGTLLTDVRAATSLPTITLAVAPGGISLSGIPRREAELLADAPPALLPRIQSASADATHGLTVTLRSGPAIYFGGSSQLPTKWSSAVAVLASRSAAGAGYIDVTDPTRPAAGAKAY